MEHCGQIWDVSNSLPPILDFYLWFGGLGQGGYFFSGPELPGFEII